MRRRNFLFTLTATASGGLQLSLGNGPFETNYIRVDRDGRVTLAASQTEIGQDISTAHTRIIADEMEADWARVTVVRVPLDPRRYLPQGSGGSDGVISSYQRLRAAGAQVREVMRAAAARQWNVPVDECRAFNGEVIHDRSARKLGYGILAADAAALPLPAKPVLKQPSEFRYIGRDARSVHHDSIVKGEPIFGLDVSLPGMRFAAVQHAPEFDARLGPIDDREARKVPGFRAVVPIEGTANPTVLQTGVAVVADSTWAAFEAGKRLKVEWRLPEKKESDAALAAQFTEALAKPGKVLSAAGDTAAAIAKASRRFEAEYEVPYLAHAALEPINCAARVTGNRCEIWGPMQSPGGARRTIAAHLGIPPENVSVHPTRIGGGFGRRLLSDYCVEAAVVARAIGEPVQVVWTREEDLAHDYYRPASRHRLQAALDDAGHLVAWHHHIAGVSRNAYRQDPAPPETTEIYSAYGAPAKDPARQFENLLIPILVPNVQLEFTHIPSRVPTGAWRAPAHNALAFAIEGFLDEIAHAAKLDPVALREQFLGEPANFPYRGEDLAPYDPSRVKQVLRLAAQKAGWGKPLPAGWGRGIAAHFTFGSYAAEVVEVSTQPGRRFKVERVVAAVDCGLAVHPAGVEAQTHSGVIDGLSAAIFGGMKIEGSRARQTNFHQYRLLRLAECPRIEVHIHRGSEQPSGFGEIALPPAAPALVNALFAASGERIRKLPLVEAGWRLV